MNKILAALTKKRGARQGKLPTKRSMNLYIKVKDGNSWQVFVPLAIFLALVVLCIYRLGVVDRLNKLNTLQQENSRLEAQLNSLNEQIAKYPELEEEYRRYTTSYLREEEQGLLNRSRIFDMIEECTTNLAVVKSISIENNQVGLVVDLVSLNDIEVLQDRLNAMPNVDEIKVSTARGTNNVEVEGNIIFTVKRNTVIGDNNADSTLSAEERESKLQQFSQAAADARDAIANAANQAAAGVSSAVSNASSAAGNRTSGSTGSSGSTSAQGSSAGSGAGTASGSAAQSSQGSSAGTTQTINGDEVTILQPGMMPQGFASLEEGMAQLNQSGGGQ